jgi:putative ABC transport system permease protein
MLTFAGAGLVLSAAGIYGVLSCLVSQQLREIGVRLMLGAEPRAIARRVLYGGLATVAIGIGIGVCVTAAVARALGSLFFSVQPHDAWSYGIVTIMLLLAGGASAWRPALRARRADPLALLRNE